MRDSYFKRVEALTATRFWINNVTEKEADLALENGAVGCTQNPSYTNKMLNHKDGNEAVLPILDEIISRVDDDEKVEVELQRALVKKISEHFLPLYEESQGEYGYVSVQGNPFRETTDEIVENALFNREAGPNIMAKVPATEEGLEAIKILIPQGVPINATEVMSVAQAMDVCDIYDEAASKMSNPPKVYFSHIAGIFDEYMKGYVEDHNIDVNSDYLFQGGLICSKKIDQMRNNRKSKVGFISGGARSLYHFTEHVGGDVAITINWNGSADKLIELDGNVIDRFNAPANQSAVDSLLCNIDEFRKAWLSNGLKPEEYEDYGPVVLFRTSFEKNWKEALEFIKNRRSGK